PPTTSPSTTSPSPTTTGASATESSDSGDDFPWWAVVLGVVVVLAIAVGVTSAAKRKGRHQAVVDTWRQRTADETAEIGATARLLAAGTPVSPTINQQVLASLRALDDLARTAPDQQARATAHQARQAVQALAIAIDAEASTRHQDPPATA